jgi:hypothetical protein
VSRTPNPTRRRHSSSTRCRATRSGDGTSSRRRHSRGGLGAKTWKDRKAEKGVEAAAQETHFNAKLPKADYEKKKSNGGLISVYRLIELLDNGDIATTDFEPIRIIQSGQTLITLDNRRLFIHRRCDKAIACKWATDEELKRESWKFTNKKQAKSGGTEYIGSNSIQVIKKIY